MSTSPSADDRPFRVYDAKSIGQALRHYRKKAGLTQAELAKAVGISRSYLSRVENGLETEHLGAILRLLGILHVRATIRPEDW